MNRSQRSFQRLDHSLTQGLGMATLGGFALCALLTSWELSLLWGTVVVTSASAALILAVRVRLLARAGATEGGAAARAHEQRLENAQRLETSLRSRLLQADVDQVQVNHALEQAQGEIARLATELAEARAAREGLIAEIERLEHLEHRDVLPGRGGARTATSADARAESAEDDIVVWATQRVDG